MILLADSGSTKTDWVLLNERSIYAEWETIGLNPYYTSDEVFHTVLGEADFASTGDVASVFFYGSGCSSLGQVERVRKALLDKYPKATIHVEHDLLGAARALCGREPGIATILGTGSNSCYFDGGEVVSNVPSVGYILGDEGSGACLGKRLLAEVLTERCPTDIADSFWSESGLQLEDILKKVYSESFPNRFLASFTRFCADHREHAFIRELINQNFRDFIDCQLLKYPESHNLPIHTTGSIGHFFREEWRNVLETSGLIPGKILQKPMKGLIEYHTHE